jgi:hypothetical protein
VLHTMLFKKETNRGEAKGASPRLQRHPRSWLWCLSGGPKDFGSRFAYDNRMTFAIYTRATEGMQDAATATLEETFS